MCRNNFLSWKVWVYLFARWKATNPSHPALHLCNENWILFDLRQPSRIRIKSMKSNERTNGVKMVIFCGEAHRSGRLVRFISNPEKTGFDNITQDFCWLNRCLLSYIICTLCRHSRDKATFIRFCQCEHLSTAPIQFFFGEIFRARLISDLILCIIKS